MYKDILYKLERSKMENTSLCGQEWGFAFHRLSDKLIASNTRIVILIDGDQMSTDVLTIRWLIDQHDKLIGDIHAIVFARSTTMIPANWPIESWCSWFNSLTEDKNAADIILTLSLGILYEKERNFRLTQQNYPKVSMRYIIASLDNFRSATANAILSFPECMCYEFDTRDYDLAVIICLDALEYQDIKLHPQATPLLDYLKRRIMYIITGNWISYPDGIKFRQAITNIDDRRVSRLLTEKARLCCRIIDEVIILRRNESRMNPTLRRSKQFFEFAARIIDEMRFDPEFHLMNLL